jgi:hypothetical protein
MASWLGLLNQLLPFATPGTPVIQDLIHLSVLAALLYFAPQIQQGLRQHAQHEDQTGLDEEVIQNAPVDPEQDFVVEEENQNHDQADPEEHEEHGNEENHDLPGHPVEGEAGPANAPNMPTQRNVGAKKAKSLARRDQRRAYNEFQRTQGEAQRARDAEGAAEREAEQNAERERRRAAAAVVEAKKAKERQQRREQERRERENEIIRRDEVLALVRRELDQAGTVNIFDVANRMAGDADEVWVERIMSAGGMLGWSSDGERLTLILSTGWVARISRDDMQRVYEKATSAGSTDSTGRISLEGIGSLLEAVLKEGS